MTYEEQMKWRPHVVILGAGASCAAIPNGDKNGKKISAMKGFIEKLGLKNIISSLSLDTTSDNLEDIYMEISEKSTPGSIYEKAKLELETKIYEYISEYTIPDNPTVYDFLILSLTSLAFLHGNVAIGYCEKDNVIGNIGGKCKCGEPLQGIGLLYPIKNKNYQKNPAISKSWEALQNALEVAYMITIFGYSAPKSDVEAVSMLKNAWGNVTDRTMEEIEIVDLRPEEEVFESWQEFIYTHHYSYHNDFFDTTLGRYPRRSCEATFDRLMNCRFLDGSKGFKNSMDFNDISLLVNPLIQSEKWAKEEKTFPINPYL